VGFPFSQHLCAVCLLVAALFNTMPFFIGLPPPLQPITSTNSPSTADEVEASYPEFYRSLLQGLTPINLLATERLSIRYEPFHYMKEIQVMLQRLQRID
jgi:hypothetical protein